MRREELLIYHNNIFQVGSGKNPESHRDSHRKDMSPLTQDLNYRSACDHQCSIGYTYKAADGTLWSTMHNTFPDTDRKPGAGHFGAAVSVPPSRRWPFRPFFQLSDLNIPILYCPVLSIYRGLHYALEPCSVTYNVYRLSKPQCCVKSTCNHCLQKSVVMSWSAQLLQLAFNAGTVFRYHTRQVHHSHSHISSLIATTYPPAAAKSTFADQIRRWWRRQRSRQRNTTETYVATICLI